MPKKRFIDTDVASQSTDVDSIKKLNCLFNGETSHPKLVGSNGEIIPIPESVYQALCQIIGVLAAGQAVSIVPKDREISTQEAADLLNVSRPYLIKLLEEGKIPYYKVGTHRRICSRNLETYKNQRDFDRQANLCELTEFLQEEGFYDYDGETFLNE